MIGMHHTRQKLIVMKLKVCTENNFSCAMRTIFTLFITSRPNLNSRLSLLNLHAQTCQTDHVGLVLVYIKDA